MEYSGKTTIEKTKSSDVDLATKVDVECEELIREAVRNAFPNHSFLGEEGVAPGSQASIDALEKVVDDEWLWIVDPIDGTTNFVAGLFLSTVSVAVSHKGVMHTAGIFHPHLDCLYFGSVYPSPNAVCISGGVTTPLRVDTAAELKEANIAYGTKQGSSPHFAPTYRACEQLAATSRSLRNLGSAALHMALVSKGSLTCYFQLDIHSWDISAGALLIQLGGGRVTDTYGNPYTLRTRNVVASNGLVHDALLAQLRAGNALDIDNS
eukprot:CAMPEP_0119136206 /NCGR_PEP_ID=MMETSP1310-20130426/20938_1 /TAXON_ID=464262 /ORGANISM="Genus nov. species nov., Strain RCC2339" /LENGTH=264 /DNA_ID=CAMNT_0007127175 /DNA_START=111 /DNA_END=905 /DNA_ORIENTATION=+